MSPPVTVAALVRSRWKSSLRETEVEDLHVPVVRVTKTFSGLRSRWTMPRACAASRPRAICVAIATALRRRERTDRERSSRSDSPVEQFGDGVAHAVRRCRSREWRGCSDGRAPRRRAPRARSARRDPDRRRRRSGSDLDRDIAAQARQSCARYTSPMPPDPRGARTSYVPRRVPRARGIGDRMVTRNLVLSAGAIYGNPVVSRPPRRSSEPDSFTPLVRSS